MLEELRRLIEGCVREVAAEQEAPMPEALGPETRLFGEGGLFDSVGLVSLVVAVEEAIQDRMDASVSLADERAMSQKRSPYRTISSLAEYARTLLEELSSKAG